jgi:hypothetical protein
MRTSCRESTAHASPVDFKLTHYPVLEQKRFEMRKRDKGVLGGIVRSSDNAE